MSYSQVIHFTVKVTPSNFRSQKFFPEKDIMKPTYESLKLLREYESFGEWLRYRWALLCADRKLIYRIKMERERELQWFRNRWQNRRRRKQIEHIDLKYTRSERR